MLGRGGMGAVWRGRHVVTGRRLAIKVLDESFLKNKDIVERFGREARAASAIQHPGIVEVLDLDRTDGGVPFLVMEYLDGETLAARIEKRGRLSEEELLHVARLLLEALDAAHSHGVVHRDLKPENIYVVPAGRSGEAVKILDFGISSKADEVTSKLTIQGSVLGTPHYMSPEQAMGDGEVDHRADLYSAGVCFYECVVGDVPYDAANYNKLLRTILDEVPEAPRERGAHISPGIERVILWAMEKDRDRRLQTAREMLEWLDRAVGGEEVPYEAPAESPFKHGGRGRRSVEAAHPKTAVDLPALSEAPRQGPSPSMTTVDRPETLLEEPGLEGSGTRVERPSMRTFSRPPSEAPDLFDQGPSQPPPEIRFDGDIDKGTEKRVSGRVESSLGMVGRGYADLGLDEEPPPDLELDEQALRPGSTKGRRSSLPSKKPRPVTGTYNLSRSPGPRSSLAGAAKAKEKPKSRTGLYLTLILVALVALGGLVVGLRYLVRPALERRYEPEEPTAPRAEPSLADLDVTLELRNLPDGARITLDGIPARNPIRMRRGVSHTVEIQAEGYERKVLDLSPAESGVLEVRLERSLR